MQIQPIRRGLIPGVEAARVYNCTLVLIWILSCNLQSSKLMLTIEAAGLCKNFRSTNYGLVGITNDLYFEGEGVLIIYLGHFTIAF